MLFGFAVLSDRFRQVPDRILFWIFDRLSIYSWSKLCQNFTWFRIVLVCQIAEFCPDVLSLFGWVRGRVLLWNFYRLLIESWYRSCQNFTGFGRVFVCRFAEILPGCFVVILLSLLQVFCLLFCRVLQGCFCVVLLLTRQVFVVFYDEWVVVLIPGRVDPYDGWLVSFIVVVLSCVLSDMSLCLKRLCMASTRTKGGWCHTLCLLPWLGHTKGG